VGHLVSLLVLVFLSSCTHVPGLDTCANPDARKNSIGQVLPVAISYVMPNDWIKVDISNPMVLEERIIDIESKTKMKAFYFDGMRDMLEPNIERWEHQFLTNTRKLITKKHRLINHVPVVEFEMSGTYIDKIDPMDPISEAVLREKYTMHAYIVETQTGTWFFKTIAPSNVIKVEDANLELFIESIHELG